MEKFAEMYNMFLAGHLFSSEFKIDPSIYPSWLIGASRSVFEICLRERLIFWSFCLVFHLRYFLEFVFWWFLFFFSSKPFLECPTYAHSTCSVHLNLSMYFPMFELAVNKILFTSFSRYIQSIFSWLLLRKCGSVVTDQVQSFGSYTVANGCAEAKVHLHPTSIWNLFPE